ncbi:S9 family peptidase [Iamia sp.]|uniref:S9 family peptidase n=1 Tax=Iamia sp. TaxID=2722710 RepID=UPI002C738A38|nr:S9 family peptidase [Iamia sp.]HXH58232.1 S9 family peptidase [Iamia sp.]
MITGDPSTPRPRFAPAEAPVAPRRAARRIRHGHDEADDLGWMRDHSNAALLRLLEAEDAHAEAVLAPLAPLIDEIEAEIRARTQEDDMSVPHRKGGWWYQTRTEEGASYAIHERRPDVGDGSGPAADAPVELILDENALAEGLGYLSVGVADISPDGWLLAYALDVDGSEAHELRVRDLRTCRDLPVAIANVSYGFAWAADSEAFLYTTLDPAHRPWRVHTHHLGANPTGAEDPLVLEEPDDRFFVGVGSSRSGDLITVDVGSAVTSELRLVDAHAPEAGARLAIPRRQGVEVQVAHHGDWLYLVSNDDALDFALWRAPLAAPDRGRWQPVVAHSPGTRLLGVEAFRDHLVLHLRSEGRPALRVIDVAALDRGGGAPDPATVAAASRDLTFPDAGYTLGGAANEEWDTRRFRFSYQSLATPGTVFEEDLATGERFQLKRMPVLGDFDPGAYRTARVWAPSGDGAEVPVSIVHRADVAPDGTAPLVLYGYGAYEISMDPWFSIARLSLLDRGVTFAVAHVRGGGEMGRRWYEDGKLAAKPSSFADLVAVADHLASEGWAAPDRIATRGGSAGGLLVAAAVNRAPQRFRAVVAEVPFVDALNTILDPEAPLTATEWEEWGNPITDPEAFAVMRGYSPTENVGSGPYPAIYATGGRHDPRVGVHEPATWVQRLREHTEAAPERPVVLRVELGAGHGGPSGRYDAWRKEAEVLAFLLTALDVTA